MNQVLDDFLEHYGVKGQRWGVRKSRNAGTTRFGKKASELDDDELASRIRRMEAERKYETLNAPVVSPGRSFISRVMDRSGTAVATTIVSGAALYGVTRMLDQRLGAGTGSAITGRTLPAVAAAARTVAPASSPGAVFGPPSSPTRVSRNP